jgi:hypothetical protein
MQKPLSISQTPREVILASGSQHKKKQRIRIMHKDNMDLLDKLQNVKSLYNFDQLGVRKEQESRMN